MHHIGRDLQVKGVAAGADAGDGGGGGGGGGGSCGGGVGHAHVVTETAETAPGAMGPREDDGAAEAAWDRGVARAVGDAWSLGTLNLCRV